MNSNKKSILEIAERFKVMEVDHNLFNRQTPDGIYYWNVLRYHVYMTVLSQFGVYENIDLFLNKKSVPLWKRVLKTFRILPSHLVNEIRFNFFLKKPKKYAFLLVSRFEDKDGNPQDLLMKDIFDLCKEDAFEIEFFRHPLFSWSKNVGNKYFLTKVEIKTFFEKRQIENWAELCEIINRTFEINIDWSSSFDLRMADYRRYYKFFIQLFKKIRPQFLFFQSEPQGMIAAARELGIVTLDLQHGHTNNVDMFYSYPENLNLKHINSISSIFLTLGEFWNHIIDYPNKKITCGSNYFFIERDATVSHNRGVMAVSSMFVHDYLKEQIFLLAKSHPELNFFYKLHSNQAHQINESKTYFSTLENVNVVYTEKNVKDIMNDCFSIVLIQSSVSYQALQKGLKVYILKKDYYEASYDIFDQPNTYLVDDWQMISKSFQNLDWGERLHNNVFFERFNPNTIKQLVN